MKSSVLCTNGMAFDRKVGLDDGVNPGDRGKIGPEADEAESEERYRLEWPCCREEAGVYRPRALLVATTVVVARHPFVRVDYARNPQADQDE